MEREISKQVKDFLNVYGMDISEHAKLVNKQFRNIIFYGTKRQDGKNWAVQKKNRVIIKVVDTGTRVQLDEFTDEVIFTLFIGFNDILAVAEGSNMEIFDAFCKLITHEYMHFLLGHLNIEKIKETHNFVKKPFDFTYIYFSTDENEQYNIIFSDPDESGTNLSADRVMYNIACDMRINNIINMQEPSLRATYFGLPEGLNEKCYYAIIFHLLNSYPDGEIVSKTFRSTGRQSYIADHYMHLRDIIRKQWEANQEGWSYDIAEEAGNTKYEVNYDALIKALDEAKFNNLQGNLPAYATKIKIAKTGIWKDFYTILRELEKKSQKRKLSFVDKTTDWCKYNNRKEGLGLLYPGKYEIDGAVERKIKLASVIFVDISGSISEVIEPLFTFCYFALKNCNCEIVFYDTQIQAVFDKANALHLEPFVCGGTNALNALVEWEQKNGKKLSNIIILSDCYDFTLKKILASWSDVSIWKVTRNTIRPY